MTTPSEEQPPAPTTTAPTVSTAPPRSRWGWPRVPAHVGPARTSTVIIAVLFAGVFALWLVVRPETATVATTGSTGGAQLGGDLVRCVEHGGDDVLDVRWLLRHLQRDQRESDHDAAAADHGIGPVELTVTRRAPARPRALCPVSLRGGPHRRRPLRGRHRVRRR